MCRPLRQPRPFAGIAASEAKWTILLLCSLRFNLQTQKSPAGRTLIFDLDKVRQLAAAHGLAIIAV
jgi:hypothetical protein